MRKEKEMDKKVRAKLEQRIRQFIFDDIEEHPFYVGEKTVKHFADACEAVYNAMAETAELEVENQPSVEIPS